MNKLENDVNRKENTIASLKTELTQKKEKCYSLEHDQGELSSTKTNNQTNKLGKLLYERTLTNILDNKKKSILIYVEYNFYMVSHFYFNQREISTTWWREKMNTKSMYNKLSTDLERQERGTKGRHSSLNLS